MARGVINLILGGIMIIGGLSGDLVLKGTDSGGALAIFGVIIAGVGIFRLTSATKKPAGY